MKSEAIYANRPGAEDDKSTHLWASGQVPWQVGWSSHQTSNSYTQYE